MVRDAGDAGRRRAVIDAVFPVVDGGRFPVKCIAGDSVAVLAHCFTDGHDKLRTVLVWQNVNEATPYEVEMTAQVNDVWTAQFTPPVPGRYRFTVTAWVDHFESWRRELERRDEEGDVRIALEVGAGLVDEAAGRAADADAALLTAWSVQLRDAAGDRAGHPDIAALKALALDPARAAITARHADRSLAVSESRELVADRRRAQFSSCTNCSRARPHRPPVPTGLSATSRRASPMSPRWASMCCTCRPSIRSAASTARARTTH